MDDWDHFDDFETPVKGEGAGPDEDLSPKGAGAQICNTENRHLPTVEYFGPSDEACFVSAGILAVKQGGAQSGHTDGDSPINTTKHVISVKHKSLLSDEDKSIDTGINLFDEIEENFNCSTGQCLYSSCWVCFMCVFIFITLSKNSSIFLFIY